MTSTQIPSAYQLGAAAFAAGLGPFPLADPALAAIVGDGPVGTAAKPMRQWIAGWTAANLAEEV